MTTLRTASSLGRTTRRTLFVSGAAAMAAYALRPTRRALATGNGATVYPVSHTPAEWRRLLTPNQYAVLREADTEAPFSSPLLDEHRPGHFTCAGCAEPAFDSATKFDSGTGWPSFYRALPHAVIRSDDDSLGMERTEIHCARCGGHLGHVFDDGPAPTGLRYCMNGVALGFVPA